MSVISDDHKNIRFKKSALHLRKYQVNNSPSRTRLVFTRHNFMREINETLIMRARARIISIATYVMVVIRLLRQQRRNNYKFLVLVPMLPDAGGFPRDLITSTFIDLSVRDASHDAHR